MAISDIDTINVEKFKRKETENLNTIFLDVVHEYDPLFWKNYNFIKPDVPLLEAIQKIQFELD